MTVLIYGFPKNYRNMEMSAISELEIYKIRMQCNSSLGYFCITLTKIFKMEFEMLNKCC